VTDRQTDTQTMDVVITSRIESSVLDLCEVVRVSIDVLWAEVAQASVVVLQTSQQLVSVSAGHEHVDSTHTHRH